VIIVVVDEICSVSRGRVAETQRSGAYCHASWDWRHQ